MNDRINEMIIIKEIEEYREESNDVSNIEQNSKKRNQTMY